jgi:lysophospholipase L1-like esterase
MRAAIRRWRSVLVFVFLGACGKEADSAAATAPPLVATVVPASAAELGYEGRFDGSGRFAWPGSAIRVRFTGTGAKVVLAEQSLENDEYGHVAHNAYDVTVDGQLATPLIAVEGTNTYPLAAGLAAGEHQIVIRKRTESYVGIGELIRFELDAGGTALPVAARVRRLEFVGDSITAGFGVDGTDPACLFSTETENYSHTYAALTADALGAAQVAIAASGAGVYRNWGATTTNTIGDLYQRTLATDWTTRWDFSRYVPDAVIFNLGTGDFSSGDPGADAFLSAYRALLSRTRQSYPKALLVVALGPMLSDLWPVGANALTHARAYVTQLVSELNAAGDANVKLVEFPDQDKAATFGCKAHPSAATQRAMADQLTAFLRQELRW